MATSSELVAVTELTAVRNKLSTAVTLLQKKCNASVSGGDKLSCVASEDEHTLWFNTEHEVTGRELNRLITQIQSVLSGNADQRKSLWKSLIEVYATIDSLDKDYLSKIEKSFDQINENYGRIKKNHEAICRDQKSIECHRIRIDELIEGHEKALNVLKKFKAKIEKLEHLEEINKLLARIDIEKALQQVDSNYRNLLQVSDKHSKAIESVKSVLQSLEENGKSARIELKQAHENLTTEFQKFKSDVERNLLQISDKHTTAIESVRADMQALADKGESAWAGSNQAHENFVTEFQKFKSDVERRMSELDLVAVVNGMREDCTSISNKSKEQSESIAVLKDEIGGLNKRMRNCMIVAWVSVIIVFLLVAMVSAF